MIHEYVITRYSLYAAISVGLVPNDIVTVLDRLSKVRSRTAGGVLAVCQRETHDRSWSPHTTAPHHQVKLPKAIEDFVLGMTQLFGKVKLLLQRNRYFIESPDPDVLEELLADEVIAKARVKESVISLSLSLYLLLSLSLSLPSLERAQLSGSDSRRLCMLVCWFSRIRAMV